MKKILFITLCLFVSVSAFATTDFEVIKTANTNIQKYSLKNGIPLYYVENTNNQVDAISICVKGGSFYLPKEMTGIEYALFSMMAKESRKYNVDKRSAIAYEKKANISALVNDNYSVLELSCINYYMEELLPLLTDSFMNPTYSAKSYETLMTSFNQSLQYEMNDPISLLSSKMKEDVFQNNSCPIRTTPTNESLQNMTIENMKKHHKSILDSRRIVVVAVGSIDPKVLVKKLNSSIGSIKAKKTELALTEPAAANFKGEPVVLTHPSVAGSGHIFRVVELPSYKDEDYAACCIAADIYSDTLFNIVRTKYGICYSPISAVGSMAFGTFAEEGLYMASNFTDFVQCIEEAREIMAKGQYIESVKEDGSYILSTIDSRLTGKKNSLINSLYSSNTTTSGLLWRYVRSLMNYDDITACDNEAEKYQAVTSSDVTRVFSKYWLSDNSRWCAVIGPELKETIKF